MRDSRWSVGNSSSAFRNSSISRCRLRYSERNRLRKMVNSHADMLVPGSKESRFAQARSRASCTRSSARSTLPHSEMANARSEGTAASITSRTGLLGGAICPLIFVVSDRGGFVCLFLAVCTGFVCLVQPAKDFGEPIGNALVDHVAIHSAELLPDLDLDVGPELYWCFRRRLDLRVGPCPRRLTLAHTFPHDPEFLCVARKVCGFPRKKQQRRPRHGVPLLRN